MKKILKSRTFWGGLLFAVTKSLEAAGAIPAGVAATVESIAVALGLIGARNVKSE